MHKVLVSLIITLLSISHLCAQKPYHGDGIDDVLRFAPFVTVYSLKACGLEGESSWKRLTVNTAASVVISSGTAWILKKAIKKERPDGTDFHSFPSGHSTLVFTGAHILHKEYGKVSPWISVGGYTIATLTAADRIRRNRHDWLDVVSGTAIGIASTELGYWLGDKISGESRRVSVVIAPNELCMIMKL